MAVAALLMWLATWATPAWRFVFPGYAVAAIALTVVGGLISLAGVAEFRRARTTVNPMKPFDSSALVANGVYQWTRNPMYLGFAVVLLGWAVFLASPVSLVVIPGFVLYMNRFQIAPEERALQARFGADFENYRRRVRRWM
jgi:protein-S-isoprenylcysteine O-methyltransferase Ste14